MERPWLVNRKPLDPKNVMFRSNLGFGARAPKPLFLVRQKLIFGAKKFLAWLRVVCHYPLTIPLGSPRARLWWGDWGQMNSLGQFLSSLASKVFYATNPFVKTTLCLPLMWATNKAHRRVVCVCHLGQKTLPTRPWLRKTSTGCGVVGFRCLLWYTVLPYVGLPSKMHSISVLSKSEFYFSFNTSVSQSCLLGPILGECTTRLWKFGRFYSIPQLATKIPGNQGWGWGSDNKPCQKLKLPKGCLPLRPICISQVSGDSFSITFPISIRERRSLDFVS